VRAELYRPEDPDAVVAVATWDGMRATVEPVGEGPEGLAAVFRPTPVVVEDASLRRLGTHGEALLQPGTFEWFRAALLTRVGAFGLAVRFVPGVRAGGWDPASQYRTFEEQVGRLTSTDP
jgi:hypothetical protein